MTSTKWTVFRELLELDQKRYCLEYNDRRIKDITKEQFEDFERLLGTAQEQPSTSEFLKGCRDLRKKGVTPEQWEYATKLGQATEIIVRLEAQLKAKDKLLFAYESVRAPKQLPAGEYPNSEFIKVQRAAAQCEKDAYEENEEWSPTKVSRLLDACDRLDRSEASQKELLTACEELVGFCYPDGKWRGWDNMEGILEIMQPIRRLAEKERKL